MSAAGSLGPVKVDEDDSKQDNADPSVGVEMHPAAVDYWMPHFFLTCGV